MLRIVVGGHKPCCRDHDGTLARDVEQETRERGQEVLVVELHPAGARGEVPEEDLAGTADVNGVGESSFA